MWDPAVIAARVIDVKGTMTASGESGDDFSVKTRPWAIKETEKEAPKFTIYLLIFSKSAIISHWHYVVPRLG